MSFARFATSMMGAAALAIVYSSSVFAQGGWVAGTNPNDIVTSGTTNNCGIGTNAPAVKLHVNGAGGSVRVETSSDANHAVALRNAANVGGASNRTWSLFQLGSGGASGGSHPHAFALEYFNGSATWTLPFVVTNTGRVGVNIDYQTLNNNFEVEGNAVIGAGYAGTNTAPTNGLLVQGVTGIGATGGFGTHQLYVAGSVFATGGFITSDVRWKKSVMPIAHALDKVMQLQGVTYDYRHDEYPQMHFPQGRQMGFVAQELEKVAPEVVLTNNDDGYKAVAYQNLTALLTEAIKEQQGTIKSLQNENTQLKSRLARIEAMLNMSAAPEAGTQKPLDLK